jgi:RNA polymerase sigma factor (sigma-70 family)
MTMTAALDPAPAPGDPGEDAADLARFLTGSQQAFAALAERHLGMVRATCVAALGSRHPWLDDACQAVFLILSRKAGEIREVRALPAWLRATARGVCANIRRTEARRRGREQAVAVGDETDPAAPPSAPEAAEQLEAAIAALTEAQREAVVRHFIQGKRQSEVAEELGVSEGAVKKRIADAMVTLRDFFARRGVAMSALLAAGAASDASAVTPQLLADCVATGAGRGSERALGLSRQALRAAAAKQLALGAAISALLVLAVAVAWAWLAQQPPRAPAAATLTLPAPAQVASDPQDAILAPIRALRRNDLRGLLAALPPASRERILARWTRFAAQPSPVADALADFGLSEARKPDAFETTLALYRPLPPILRGALADIAERRPGLLDAQTAVLLRRLGNDCDRWMRTVDLADPRVARMVTARRLATSRLWPIETVADLRAMPIDRVVDVFGRVLGSVKAWWTPEGLDPDGVLDSFHVAALGGEGDARVATLAFTAFGTERTVEVHLERRADGGWTWIGLDGVLEAMFKEVGNFFYWEQDAPPPWALPQPPPPARPPAKPASPG